jgi:cyclopropane-fatty-acyl-phospholipid synthase
MAYSGAYYEDAADSLKLAQIQKFDRICRKLELGPGDPLLEIGTGWGGFAAYAASTYGCRITTATISRQQYEFAKSRFAEMPTFGKRIKLLLEDYRNLKGQFDKIVSIEMFEAVGFRHYDEFFGACDRLLKPQGAMLLQTITMNERNFRCYLAQSDWIKKYIFPGAELASVSEMLRSMARCTRLQMTWKTSGCTTPSHCGPGESAFSGASTKCAGSASMRAFCACGSSTWRIARADSASATSATYKC